ncbi:MAG: hypothetical protein IT453_20075 [Planctomycetes bacterium]|nr:hypothetical protein [Planctomycetota bacterium]
MHAWREIAVDGALRLRERVVVTLAAARQHELALRRLAAARRDIEAELPTIVDDELTASPTADAPSTNREFELHSTRDRRAIPIEDASVQHRNRGTVSELDRRNFAGNTRTVDDARQRRETGASDIG